MHPCFLFSNEAKLLTVLIKLLVCKSKDGLVEHEAMQTIQILPLSESISEFLKKHLNKPSVSNKEHWQQVFKWDKADFSKTVYFLMGLEQLITPKAGVKR